MGWQMKRPKEHRCDRPRKATPNAWTGSTWFCSDCATLWKVKRIRNVDGVPSYAEWSKVGGF